LSGEYIEERPEMCSTRSCSLTSLADFGTADYGQDYTKAADPYTEYATLGGLTGPIGSFATENIIMYANNGKTQIAIPSALTTDGTSFTMKYASSPSQGGRGGFNIGARNYTKWGIENNTVTTDPAFGDHRVH
jgi:hypothetical protein